jgi:hypothetical protein
LPRTARNVTLEIFVFSDSRVYIVEAKEVTVGRYHLAGEHFGGLLAVADAQEDSEKLGVREGGAGGPRALGCGYR